MGSVALTQALIELREALAAARLPLAMPGSAEQARAAKDMGTQLDDYVLPRLATIDAPLLAVVGGSTGAGKSTLVNSLIGRRVTQPGVIRPTTRSPVLIHHPDDLRWFNDERILPGLIRSQVSSADARSLQLVAEASLPPGLALLDAPDVDSVVEQNRLLASQLLQAADLWLFVTSAARYADAVPWDFLHQAVERRSAVAVVLDRVPPAAMREVPAHLGQLMTERGLADSPLFAVPETETDADGLLPDSAVSPIRTWLATLAADQGSRQEVVLRTLDGAVRSLAERAPKVASAVDTQAEAIEQLRADATASYVEAVRHVSVQSADGTLLRGEVLNRWHEFIGTGEFMRAVEGKLSWVRDRVWGALKGTPPEADNVKLAVESGLEALVREEGQAAAERAETAWRSSPAGRDVLAHSQIDLSRASAGYPTAVARAIRHWQADVMELVAGEGMNKRTKARYLALGVNGAAVALMVFVFAHTGGLTGAEIGIAGGTSVVAQKLLEMVFGDDAVRRLARRAKADLDARVQAVLATELTRFTDVLDGLHAEAASADRIREAAMVLELARQGGYHDDHGLPAGGGAAITAGGAVAVGDAGSVPALEQGRQPVAFNQINDAGDSDIVEAELVDRDEPEHL